MLGRLIKLCPPGRAIAVVEIVLADWPFYAKRCSRLRLPTSR